MDYYHHHRQEESGSWAGYIALFLVVIIIIVGIVLFFYRATPSFLPRWTIVDGATSGTSVALQSVNGTYFIVNTSDATLQLTVAPPVISPVGSEFAVDNSKTGTVVTVVAGSSFTIQPGTTATFVWTTATSAKLLSTSA